MIVFDCDGVLVDSELLSCGTDAELMTQAGYPISIEALIASYIGWPKPAIWADIERRRGVPWPPGLLEKANATLMQRIETELQPVAGVADALGQIPGRKAVASSSSVRKLHGSLNRCGLTPLFEGRIFSTEQVAHGKPAPDVFLFCAQQCGVEMADCLVVEDSVAGVSAARAAGMPVIGFTGASHCYPGHDKALLEAGATAVVGDMHDLPGQITAIASGSLSPH